MRILSQSLPLLNDFFFRPKAEHPLSTTLRDINGNIMDGKYIACKFSDIDISSPSYLHRMDSC